MLTSIALILLLGLLLGRGFQTLRLPGLCGMILAGILLGPYGFQLLDDTIMLVSPDIRQIALIIILTRAGLSLDIHDVIKIGRPAFFMCFLPACFEIAAIVLLAPSLLGMSYLDAAVLGSVLAAVSPAVVVPRMLTIMEQGFGNKKRIPQIILAGASVDDVFVIVVFTALTALATGNQAAASSFFAIPVSIASGILAGYGLGRLLAHIHHIHPIPNHIRAIVLFGLSCLLLTLEHHLASLLPFSGLLAIMSTAMAMRQQDVDLAQQLSAIYNKLWIPAEILLFALIGSMLPLPAVRQASGPLIMVLIGAMVLRMLGVFLCFIKTNLTIKEKLFCMIAYTPKATVQAAIGAIPLSMGMASGTQILTVAVLSILLTAPLGAVAIDALYPKLLEQNH